MSCPDPKRDLFPLLVHDERLTRTDESASTTVSQQQHGQQVHVYGLVPPCFAGPRRWQWPRRRDCVDVPGCLSGAAIVLFPLEKVKVCVLAEVRGRSEGECFRNCYKPHRVVRSGGDCCQMGGAKQEGSSGNDGWESTNLAERGGLSWAAGEFCSNTQATQVL